MPVLLARLRRGAATVYLNASQHRKVELMNVRRLFAATVSAFALASAVASAAGLPVYPGAVPGPRAPSTVSHCGHMVTETQYRVNGPSVDAVMSWYAMRLPNSARVKLTVGDITNNAVYDGGGTRAASMIGTHLLTLLTYSPPVGAAGVAVMKRASAGDQGAINQLKTCKAG
jgi:hypothetical protein